MRADGSAQGRPPLVNRARQRVWVTRSVTARARVRRAAHCRAAQCRTRSAYPRSKNQPTGWPAPNSAGRLYLEAQRLKAEPCVSEWTTNALVERGQCRRTSADQATSSPRASGRSPTLARPPTAPPAEPSLQGDALRCARTGLRCALLSAVAHACARAQRRTAHAGPYGRVAAAAVLPSHSGVSAQAGLPTGCAATTRRRVSARTERLTVGP